MARLNFESKAVVGHIVDGTRRPLVGGSVCEFDANVIPEGDDF
ncbi:hypothetical protein ACFFQF_05235 [Haladaptatus pallidirubidus]